MENHNEEWEIVDYPSNDEDSNEWKMSWILSKGLGIGKKILITGFVMSSAPLVLPPLVVISAIGFVVSVPSGIFLASYACTEKFMNKLLPMPYRNGEEDYYIDMQKEEDEERKDIQRGVKSRIELEDERASSNDEIEGADYGEGVKGNAVEIPIEENGYEKNLGKEKAEEKLVVESKNQRKEEPVKVEEVVVLNLTEADDGSGISTVDDVFTAVIEEKESEEREEDLTKETRTLLEQIRDEGKADDQKSSQDSSTSKGVKTGELPVSSGAEVKDAGSTSEKGVKSVPSSEAKKKKNVKKKPQEQQQQQKYWNATVYANALVALSTPMEQKTPFTIHIMVSNIDEEKVWEQIEAVRGIVGYKGTPQKSSIEEVRALYIFTGVEPPASFEENTDMAQVDSKLQFLMSIIGVK
ncbi:hypothetical protein G4B88_028478 [Cannabis sativa]|uniref:Uncharacterized protein n=1 Tax=Cannabis sativa TaxID=3483 RepID=A0A7J6GNA2_CANSA|nr:hypothetical protein G4B88_028478 [Cannabis sativa]